jgi:hypothetical protein
MIDFAFSPEEEALRREVAEFCRQLEARTRERD